ncbi:MAG: hypothetical protein J5949_08605 [Oscillospiraceae bacterium]|nr:hypothetical protein [Oscillospiraceae bacterium]
MFSKITEFFNQIKILHIDTGICPRCGSPLTARLRKGPEGKKKIGLLGPIYYGAIEDPEYNCACMLCEVKWRGERHLTRITRGQESMLWKEFIRIEQFDEHYDQKAILKDLTDEMAFAEDLPKEKPASFVASVAGSVFKKTLKAPLGSIESLARDAAGMAHINFSVDSGDSDTDEDNAS